jgi:hypothetical protein
MKTTLFAAIAALALITAAPAFADQAHHDPVAAGARSTWRTNQSDGAGAKEFLAALEPQDFSHIAPRVALSDRAAIS